MIADAQQLCRELALFADLGTTPPEEARDKEQPVFRLSREGQRLELRFDGGVQGKVIERSLDGGESREHESYRALLASEKFGDLRRWAGSQRASLKAALRSMGEPIPVQGILANHGAHMDVEQIDDLLASPDGRSGDASSVQVLLIDGPAGIGKTNFIERLALSRAAQYTISQRPLILHVQSRGRVGEFPVAPCSADLWGSDHGKSMGYHLPMGRVGEVGLGPSRSGSSDSGRRHSAHRHRQGLRVRGACGHSRPRGDEPRRVAESRIAARVRPRPAAGAFVVSEPGRQAARYPSLLAANSG